MTATKKRKRLKSGDKVKVRHWDSSQNKHVLADAFLDNYSHVSGTWQFKQPCPVVWAYRDDIEPIEDTSHILLPGCFHASECDVYAEAGPRVQTEDADGFGWFVAECDSVEAGEALAKILNGLTQEQLEPLSVALSKDRASD